MKSTVVMDTSTSYDIDQADDYDQVYADIRRPETKDFVVVFGAAGASCSVNVSLDDVSRILSNRQTKEQADSCIWLNLWGWESRHEQMIRLVAKQYGLSPRLTHVLCPKSNERAQTESQHPSGYKVTTSSPIGESDKMGISTSTSGVSLQQQSQPKARMPTSIADIADNLWHFCAVDYGARYVCISWNALFFRPLGNQQARVGKPNAVRVWSSMLLCDDGTVVSTFECPSALWPEAIVAIRDNQLNVFRHFSMHGVQRGSENALMQINIRTLPSSADHPQAVDNLSVAHSLFYYLFDDWMSIYYQAIGGPDSYRNQLELLRQKMTDSANVEDVTTLHRIGRELSVLRAVYRGYQSIIERLVQKSRYERSQGSVIDAVNFNTSTDQTTGDKNSIDYIDAAQSNIQLTRGVIARFERLLDRINLVAIAEVNECLKEKDDLVMMVFITPAIFHFRFVQR